jgi:hypothetical protein
LIASSFPSFTDTADITRKRDGEILANTSGWALTKSPIEVLPLLKTPTLNFFAKTVPSGATALSPTKWKVPPAGAVAAAAAAGAALAEPTAPAAFC